MKKKTNDCTKDGWSVGAPSVISALPLKIAASTQSPSRVPQSPGGIYGHTDDVTEADSGGAIVVGDPNLGAKGPSLSSGSARSNDKRSRMQPAKGLKSH